MSEDAFLRGLTRRDRLGSGKLRCFCSGWGLTALSDTRRHWWAYVQSAVLVSIWRDGRHVLLADTVSRQEELRSSRANDSFLCEEYSVNLLPAKSPTRFA